MLFPKPPFPPKQPKYHGMFAAKQAQRVFPEPKPDRISVKPTTASHQFKPLKK